MSIIRKMRKQKACWWERSAAPDAFGAYSFSSPVEIDCRWEDTNQPFRNAQGEEEVARSVVYVDREMKRGDRLRLGPLVYEVLEDPLQMTDAFEIESFQKMPNLRATETLFVALLQ